MIRLGLIGCGAWGKNYVAAAEESGVAVITHAVSRSAERLSKPMACFADWHDILGEPLDGFIVSTPPEPRAEIILELAQSNMPMMVEKPLCLSSQEAIAIQSVLGDAPFLVDYVHLFAPAYEELRERVGDLDGRMRCYGRSSGPTKRSYSLLWDHAPHDLSMCLGLGAAHAVKADVRDMAGDGGVELNVQFEGDIDARLRFSYGQKRREFSVTCGGHGFGYDGDDGSLVIDGVSKLFTEKPLTRAVRCFAEAIRTGKTNWRFGIDDSVTITRVLEEVQRAAG